MSATLTDLINQSKSGLPLIMGIINLTDNSFYDGGKYNQFDKALKHSEKLIKDGANILDLGAESSRPGATAISQQEELDKLLPLIEALKNKFDISISVDTYKPKVMTEVVQYGADMINDIFALRNKGALAAMKKLQVPFCLMHMQNNPQTMQINPNYKDVLIEVYQFLKQRVETCLNAGIKKERIIIDVGFGFGKTLDHNLILLNNLEKFKQLQLPLLAGISRKSMLGKILANDQDSRLIPSVLSAIYAYKQGANILRVHDVYETKQALITLKHFSKFCH